MLITLIFGCSFVENPSDDPFDYVVEDLDYTIELSDLKWVVPSGNLPEEVDAHASNNNVDIHYFEGRLYMAWRSSPTHFAGEDTVMWVVSSGDEGQTWDFEHRIEMDADVREPRFLSMNDELQLSYFEAGTNPLAFEPLQLWRIWKADVGWSEPEAFLTPESVLWDVKVRSGMAYMTTYDGAHYQEGEVYVRFWQSENARDWVLVDDVESVYVGGVSEVAFEFDTEGNLWTVGRNEDGDATGAGSQICFAKKDSLANWQCLEESDPERYDSPELFRHGEEIYMLARRDVGGPYGPDGDLLAYSLRPKAFSLYKLNREAKTVEWIQDLPGVGDTSFPSVRRLDDHVFRFVNYTSPLDKPDITWLAGQTSELGTQIYMMDITFMAP
jgi:hypothetical protein